MVRLVTVVGHGVDLLPHFINHYKSYVDEIYIVLYLSNENKGIDDDIKEIIKHEKNVKIIKTIYHKAFDWSKVTQCYNEIKNLYPDDWWVVADVDEFHLYPNNNLKLLIRDCETYGWDLIRGGFIDRVGDGGYFPEIVPYQTIWKQFPHGGFFRYPMSGACPNKICIMKGYIKLTSGQHYAEINGHTTWGWQGWSHPLINPLYGVQVHHFKWDKSSIKRLKNIAQKNEDYAFSDEYKKMYESLKKNNFILDIHNKNYIFEYDLTTPDYNNYRNWNRLFNIIKTY